MYVKYKEYKGKLLNYEYVEETDIVIVEIKIEENARMKIVCKSGELKVPNIMGNYEILDK